jgi:hypothetical protein
MVEEAVKSYRVAYDRDESGGGTPPWQVCARLPHTGSHRREARRRIREALALFVDDARKAHRRRREAAEIRRRGQFAPTATLRKKADEDDRQAALAARRRPRLANRNTLDERARCCSS